MILIIPILTTLLAGVLSLDVSPGDTVRFELQIGTLTAIGSLEFELDYCSHTASSLQQTTTAIEQSNKNPLNPPSANVYTGEPSKTQRLTRTVIETVLVTVTKSVTRPATAPSSTTAGSRGAVSANCTSSSNRTVRTVVDTIGTLTGLMPTNSSLGNVSFIRSPTPTAGLTATSDGYTLSQRAWYYFTMLVIASSVPYI
ncbi:uncharacterized protein PG998_014812 [Apiospora kogelbergensis]|uniref:uncharacterized protein n=1 Tax=Apiospora kogelbergensis TaxID=1337665 RepID=UPI00312FDD4E